MGQGRAGIGAGGTGDAFVLVTLDTRAGQTQSLLRASVKTVAATDAFFDKMEDFRRNVYTLRVMAPPTGERATFEKDCRSDVRAIVQSIPFDGKDVGGKRIHTMS
jgi:hypothetical protein